jgi:formylglycine-generating enzyme required for sulfatase activity
MKRRYLAAATVSAALLVIGSLAGARYLQRERAERLHFERGETELIVANLARVPVQLFRAGKTLHEAQPIEFNGERAWLAPGNYFLKAGFPAQSVFYPAPLTGFRRGPDANGSYAITIRELATAPPLPPAHMSEWAYVPSGNFLLGDRANPREPHYVWLPAYFISRYETTNAGFAVFMRDAKGYADDANWTEAGKAWKAAHRAKNIASSATDARFNQPDQPVTWVTWHEASAYCRWLTRTLGQGRWLYSLPSEAEWEKAARGPDGFDYALGQALSDAEVKLYNWQKNPDAPVTVVGESATPAVYSPNRYGLFHLTGNVVEWTSSVARPYHRERPYAEEERNRAEATEARVARGGSWYSASIALLQIAYRDSFQPEVSHHDLGLRVVARPLP